MKRQWHKVIGTGVFEDIGPLLADQRVCRIVSEPGQTAPIVSLGNLVKPSRIEGHQRLSVQLGTFEKPRLIEDGADLL